MDTVGTVNSENNASLYWMTVAITGVIFGVSAFFIKTVLTYIRLNSGIQSPYVYADLTLGIIILAWFIKACGGLFVSWYYSKNTGSPVNMGRAAMMGFLAGVAITIVVIILLSIWHLIDPGLAQQKFQNNVTIIKSSNLPDDQKKLFIKSLSKNSKGFLNPGKLLFSGIFSIAVPNLITAMIGAKIAGRKKDK